MIRIKLALEHDPRVATEIKLCERIPPLKPDLY